MISMRLRKEDVPFFGKESPLHKIELGLYSACEECVEAHRTRVAKRLKVGLNKVTNGMMR